MLNALWEVSSAMSSLCPIAIWHEHMFLWHVGSVTMRHARVFFRYSASLDSALLAPAVRS